MTTTIVLSPETKQRLNLLASQTGRSAEFLLQELVERGIDDVEDYYLASEVLERIRNGQESVHTAAEVRRDLGLDIGIVLPHSR